VLAGQLGKLPHGFGQMVGVGDDAHPLDGNPGATALAGLLQQAALAGKRQELFRFAAPAFGPEPRPASPGHDHEIEHWQISDFGFI
jgi:hypothetical protein